MQPCLGQREHATRTIIAERIFDMPATTAEGVRFKLDILKAYEGCDTSSFEASLKHDLLRMAGVYDA